MGDHIGCGNTDVYCSDGEDNAEFRSQSTGCAASEIRLNDAQNVGRPVIFWMPLSRDVTVYPMVMLCLCLLYVDLVRDYELHPIGVYVGHYYSRKAVL